MAKFAIHPFAEIFPLIDSLVDELAAELRKTRRPPTITLYQGKILDGRHRYLACVKAGLEPTVKQYTGKDPRAFVVRANITRRHLSTEERAALAAELATRPMGRPKTLSNDRVSDEALSVQKAAKLMKVSESSVHRAKAKKAGKQPEAAKKAKPAPHKGSSTSDLEAKIEKLVMKHLDQIEPQALLDGLCRLIPALERRIAEHTANGKQRARTEDDDEFEFEIPEPRPEYSTRTRG
jgi:hypothetical protein